MKDYLDSIDECIAVIDALRSLSEPMQTAAQACVDTLKRGGKLLICGNGGSAAQAQHLSGELVGRYKKDRPPLAALALASDVAILTCIGNDFRFEEIFSRQIRALGRAEDLLICFTTSGESPDVLDALKTAQAMGIQALSFLGRDGGSACGVSTYSLVVPHGDTARIQEGHQLLMHCLMDLIESGLAA